MTQITVSQPYATMMNPGDVFFVSFKDVSIAYRYLGKFHNRADRCPTCKQRTGGTDQGYNYQIENIITNEIKKLQWNPERKGQYEAKIIIREATR